MEAKLAASLTVIGFALGEATVRPWEFHYVNYRGESSWRKVIFRRLFYGQIDYHGQEKMWMAEGMDLDKGLVRTFAVKDMEFLVTEYEKVRG